jgi:hypothetical protein
MCINPEEVRTTITKNQSLSYGLTLVAGLPLPTQLSRTIQQAQALLENSLEGRFIWYQPTQMHVTLSALLRGRYRQFPPLERNDLPSNIDTFFNEFQDFLATQAPLQIQWHEFNLMPNGLLICRAQCSKGFSDRLINLLWKYPTFNLHQKDPYDLHLTIGYLTTPEPFLNAKEGYLFKKTLLNLQEDEMETYQVDRVWLIHYANRTLNSILGKISFILGKQAPMKSEHILHLLQIK